METPQFWEILGNNSLSTGVWGAMNASLNNTENNKFFFPDPWTFSESANPIELNRFLELPRYYAKNYLSPSKFEIFKALLNNIKFLLLKPFIKPFAKELIRSIYKIIFNGLSDNVLFCLFDIYSLLYF